MPASTLNLAIEQGATFEQPLTWLVSGGGEPVDLTGYTARMQIRKKYTDTEPLVSLTDEDGIELGGTDGTINITISAERTAMLPVKALLYDLELVREDGHVRRFVMGSISVSAEVTK